ncbi:hypothetical protein DM02DRAFT_710199 [Periconia macrospinosa]|uniref:Uncharacterized protein n=1 Tax=Periconia macrospinosa TaxID=97972 RepID=A0A2V1CYA0_9PLEO|nr:hypothetical protein DM02DRAFT_710199 [Periconia macrospinosa]
MRNSKSSTIKMIGPCIEMPRLSDPPPPGKKTRKQDMYIKVEYHSDIENNPDAKTLDLVEWVTRTEFIALIGQRFAEAKEKVHLPKCRERMKYIEECKIRGVLPETRQPLSSEDRQKYPWLSTELLVKVEESEEVEMDIDDIQDASYETPPQDT